MFENIVVRTVNAIAVQLETRIIENKIDAATRLVAEFLDTVPQLIGMISKDVFLCRSEVITTSGLKRFDLLFSHIDEQRKVCGISPKADWNESQYLRKNSVHFTDLALVQGT